jgi:hypothetical protein
VNATTRTEFQPAGATLDAGKRWLALYVLCLGDVLIVLDSTIVNVALPSSRPIWASPTPRSPGS